MADKANGENNEGNIFLDFFASVFTPGVHHPLIFTIMNWAFYALFFCMAVVILGGYANIHVFIFVGLAICLFITIQWFLSELQEAKRKMREEKKN